MHILQKKGYLIILLCIVLLGSILRFANTPDRYTFDGDAVRDAIVAYEGAKHFSFPLAGPFSSTGPYTFGPWYYVSIIFFSILAPTPYSPWILMSILSLVTILLMADIGRLLYSKTFGIILAGITAIAPTQINTAISLSNISPVIFFVTLSIWITFKIVSKEASHFLWYLALGVALGLGINTHFQMIGLLVLPLLLWIYMGWKKYQIPLLIFLGGFVTFIPLLIFNILTNGHTLNGINEMLIAKERTYVPNSWSIYLLQFWNSHLKFLFFSPTFFNVSLVLTFIVIFLRDFQRKKYSIGITMLVIVFSANFLWLRYYWGERHDVYLYYLSPLIFIFLGYTLFSLVQMKFGKILFIIFTLILGWNMITNDYTRITNSSEDLVRQELKLLHTKYPNNNIVLYSCNPYYEDHKRALVYLLRFYYQPQAQEKRIGMFSYDCKYPEIAPANSGVTNKVVRDIYPSLIPDLKEANFNFIDLSPATQEAVKNASWQDITTEDIYNSSINWWKNK